MKKMKAIFLDRDGTINVDTGHVHKISNFAFETNVITGLKLLRDAGFSFFIVTNQSGIARGIFTKNDFEKFNDHLTQQLASNGITITKTYFCPYHPTEGIGEYRQDSPLRKPSCGMHKLADKEFHIDKKSSWMIGDKWVDVQAGNNFGIKSILLKSGKGGSDTANQTDVNYTAQDFLDAAKFIINFKKNND